jgi:hypothetical protein
MTGETLRFNVHSGGTVAIDLSRCGVCETKACLGVCHEQRGPLVLDEVRGVPMLRWSLEETERGGCVECLGCELACDLYGRQAVTIALPLESFDEYLDTLTEAVVYEQEW